MAINDVEKDLNIELTENIKKAVEILEKMSVLESLTLVKFLEEKWGVSAAAAVVSNASSGDKIVDDEPSSFEVEITDASANKIAAIKLLKEIKNLSLGDAKAALDNLPYSLGEFDSKEKAEEVIKRFKDISIVASIK